MNDTLRDVITAAGDGAGRHASGPAVPRRVPKLRAVETDPTEAPTPSGFGATLTDDIPPAEEETLGRLGLRLAFWLCGFRNALLERGRQGEKPSEREESLLALSSRDFQHLRPLVIGMVLVRLHDVIHAPEFLPEAQAAAGASALEAFAFETLRNLSERGQQVAHKDGPDTALAMFGGAPGMQEPLEIFQTVFTAALALVEAFQEQLPANAKLLPQLAKALETEAQRV
jgi:hypothetical protein